MTSHSRTRVPQSVYIAQGEYAVADQKGAVISTILGSCVSTCLWDPEARVGGMNHFLLPKGIRGQGTESFGANAMELLINAMIHLGAAKPRLRAKVFGGAAMRKGFTKVGEMNGQFVLDYLHKESIPCDGHSLGGDLARRVEFEPFSGKARQRLVTDRIVDEVVAPPPPANDLELF